MFYRKKWIKTILCLVLICAFLVSPIGTITSYAISLKANTGHTKIAINPNGTSSSADGRYVQGASNYDTKIELVPSSGTNAYTYTYYPNLSMASWFGSYAFTKDEDSFKPIYYFYSESEMDTSLSATLSWADANDWYKTCTVGELLGALAYTNTKGDTDTDKVPAEIKDADGYYGQYCADVIDTVLGEEYFPVYYFQETSKQSVGKTDGSVSVICLYSMSFSQFVYMIILGMEEYNGNGTASGTQADWGACAVVTSTALCGVDWDASSSSSWTTSFKSATLDYILTNSFDTANVQSDFLAGTYTDEDYEVFNSLVYITSTETDECVNFKDETVTVTSSLKYKYCAAGEINVSWDADVNNDKAYIVVGDAAQYTYVGSTEYTVEIDPVLYSWGDSDNILVDFSGEGTPTAADEVFKTAINAIASAGSDLSSDKRLEMLEAYIDATVTTISSQNLGTLTSQADWGVFMELYYYAYLSDIKSWYMSLDQRNLLDASGNYNTSACSTYYDAMCYILNLLTAANAGENAFEGECVPFNIDGSDIFVFLSTDWELDYAESVSIKSIFDKLNSFQKDTLIAAYHTYYKNYGSAKYKLKSLYAMSYVGSYSESSASSFVSSNTLLYDTIKETIDNLDEGISNTGSIYNVARSCNSLCQYYIGMALYGSDGTNNSIYNIYNEILAGLVNGDNYFVESVNSNYFPVSLPDELTIFGTDSSYYTVLMSFSVRDGAANGWDNFVQFLWNVSYAFDACAFSDGAEQKGFKYKDLISLLEGSKDASEVNSELTTTFDNGGLAAIEDLSNEDFGGCDVYIGMLRAIIELADMCEFLGIYDDAKNGMWTEAIAAYLKFYEANKTAFDKLRNNPNIYSYAQTGESSVEEPLGLFFSVEDQSMSDQWCTGFAASALFVPMETNLYDASSISYVTDSDFIANFYYKFAFYRKALYINTDNSAIVNQAVSGEVSGTRVATLRDLLNYDRDIILTVDDNFYNANEINTVMSNLDYTAIRSGSTEDGNSSVWDSVKDWAAESFDLSAEQILKTGSVEYYSTTLANNVTKLDATESPSLTSSIADAYVLSYDYLIGDNSVWNDYEYSVKQSYGVVSAVYRDAELYNELLRALVSDNAVFKSSKAICSTPGTNSSDWRSVYNYCMLANLEEQMKNDAASTLDLDAPIFCDIFGNIVTESGLVIIPAACNATLCGTNWNPNTVGWSEYYNNGNHLETGEFSDEVYSWLTGVTYDSSGGYTYQTTVITGYEDDGTPKIATVEIEVGQTTVNGTNGESVSYENAGGYMIVESSGDLILRTSILTGKSSTAIVEWQHLNKNSNVIKELFYNDAYFTKAASGKIYSKRLVNMVVEVLRGAPIEFIDYEYEGLSGNMNISRLGVYMAYKLEQLANTLISGSSGSGTGNSLVTIPNLAFMSGFEVIALYVFKIVFAIMIVGLAISLYMDAIRNKMGLAAVGKFVLTCTLVIVAITLVPNLISWSYYNANKYLLADESGYIMMLNYAKDFDGSEIGITSVTTPETNTELYIKTEDVSISWWSIIGDVLFGNTASTVTELYEEEVADDPMAGQENIVLKGSGLYMDVQDIFDSTTIVYYPTSGNYSNVLYATSSGSEGQAGDSKSVISYCIPYYVFLDKLTAAITEYNSAKEVSAYSWSVGANGHIMTYDIISPYLTSSEFLDDGFDILGLNEVLMTGSSLTSYTYGIFSDSDLSQMSMSRWYPTGTTTDEATQDKINELYTYARNYIADNQNILGKIPDEIFLKVFALQLSIKYNQIFGIHTSNAIEIMNVDTRDIMRLLVADRGTVYKYYSYSYARFVYEESGEFGVIMSAFYLIILWLTSFLKPVLMILMLGLLIINIVCRKMLFRKESRAIEGYFIGAACLCACNYLYALMLKVSLNIAEYGWGVAASLGVAMLVQITYVLGLTIICVIEVRDWKNNGFSEFSSIGASIQATAMSARDFVVDRMISRRNEAYRDSAQSRRYTGDDYDASSVDDMLARDAEREEVGTYAPM